MKIFSKAQLYEGDKLTIDRQNISSTELMERAGIQIFNWLDRHIQGVQVPIHIFCGIGNNGGDGLVAARHLITSGYNVYTYVVNYGNKRSQDFLINYDRIKQVTKQWPVLIEAQNDFPEINGNDIILDAIFGIGLNREADPWIKQLFQHIRKSKAFTLAIDIPSGLYIDRVPEDKNGVVWADHTLSIQSPKLVFFLPETGPFTAQWEVLDIGIDADYILNTPTQTELMTKQDIMPIYKPRKPFAHKGHFGHGLIIGGSYGKIGAVTLAGRAALAAGVGLVTAFVPKCGYIPLQTAFPEAMVITDKDDAIITAIKMTIKPSAIGIGVGMGTATKTMNAFEAFLKQNKVPLVIDADGLNMLSKKKSLLKLLPKGTILTPHPKELERLIGSWFDDFDKLKKVSDFSLKHQLIVVIKGAYTITVFNEKRYVNQAVNPGLATAGSGDVLTGIITGLLAQGYDSIKAAVLGVYLHGTAADIATKTVGYDSLISSHVIDHLGDAYLDLFELPKAEKTQQADNNSGEEE